MLSHIFFEHYKAFPGREELELRPITLIIGKNSSGKSSVLKLLPMLSNMLSGKISYPLLLNNNGIINATVYEDLFFKRDTSGLKLGVKFEGGPALFGTYYVDNGIIGMYLYEVYSGEKHIKKSYGDNTTNFYGLINLDILGSLGINPESLKLDWNYIGPFRVVAPHNVAFKGFDNTLHIGYNGQETYQLLLNSYLSDKELFNNVSRWMGNFLEGQHLDFSNTNNNFGSYSLLVRHNDYPSIITGVGQGIAQVLPIITQSFEAMAGSINIIEQPVLHLHPAAHSAVAWRLGSSAKTNQCKYIIESHSENLLLGFRHMIVNPEVDFNANDIVVYNIADGEEGVCLQRIDINEKGDFSDWPTGVFSESFELLRQIMEMRAK